MENIQADVMAVFVFYGVYLLSYLSNIVFSIYQNTKVFHDNFEWNKFIAGLCKCLTFMFGTFLLVLAIDYTTYVFNQYGIIGDGIDELITISAVLSTIGVATVHYIKEAYNKFVSILVIEK